MTARHEKILASRSSLPGIRALKGFTQPRPIHLSVTTPQRATAQVKVNQQTNIDEMSAKSMSRCRSPAKDEFTLPAQWSSNQKRASLGTFSATKFEIVMEELRKSSPFPVPSFILVLKDILTIDCSSADLIRFLTFSPLRRFMRDIVVGIETRMEIQIGTVFSTFHSRRGHPN